MRDEKFRRGTVYELEKLPVRYLYNIWFQSFDRSMLVEIETEMEKEKKTNAS